MQCNSIFKSRYKLKLYIIKYDNSRFNIILIVLLIYFRYDNDTLIKIKKLFTAKIKNKH